MIRVLNIGNGEYVRYDDRPVTVYDEDPYESVVYEQKLVTLRHRCVVCGVWFSDAKTNGARYCSNEHRRQAINKAKRDKKPSAVCVYCGDPVGSRTHLYCTDFCRDAFGELRQRVRRALRDSVENA